MKKIVSVMMALTMLAAALTGCGGKDTKLSGSVSTNGSTSMEKVIGALSEQFMADNPGVTVTYDATGSGTGIEATSNGSTDIGLSSRGLNDEDKAAADRILTVMMKNAAAVAAEE